MGSVLLSLIMAKGKIFLSKLVKSKPTCVLSFPVAHYSNTDPRMNSVHSERSHSVHIHILLVSHLLTGQQCVQLLVTVSIVNVSLVKWECLLQGQHLETCDRCGYDTAAGQKLKKRQRG